MKSKLRQLAMAAMASAVLNSAPAAVRYVDVNSTNATPPYTYWATAATNIQDAVDAAVAGDQILVTNGVYQTGGKALAGTTNRVAIDKPLTVQSLNGPEVTIIDGGGTLRCAYLTNGASLNGFTLSNGSAPTGAGLACSSTNAFVSNCVIVANRASGEGGGALGGTLSNCTLISNSVPTYYSGGGASGSRLSYCTLIGNSASWGGGASRCNMNHCSLISNRGGPSTIFPIPFAGWGGAADNSTLDHCVLTGNSAAAGGGAAYSELRNCSLTRNSATGGFAYNGLGGGGGAIVSTLIGCTIVSNSVLYANVGGGGGANGCTLKNSILYFNDAPDGPNYASAFGNNSSLDYCCTTPMPTNGIGNITNAPLFIDLAGGNFHLQPNSPCIDAGTNLSSVVTNDLDGRPRPLDGNADGVAAFDIGAYEHAVLFVRQDSSSPAPPYNSWLTAATNIQDAADLALAGAGDQILVTNGVYQFGGNTSSRVVLTNALTSLQSLNGPQFTAINGGGSVRCAFLANDTFLSGFTLTNGHALDSGGGVGFADYLSTAVVSNCVVAGNSAPSAGGAGSVLVTGGGYLPVGGNLINCVMSNNSATAFQPGNPTVGIGGAADNCKLNGCTLVGNFAAYGGGGASASRLVNCRVTGNSANAEGGGTRWSWLYNCLVSGNSSGAGAAFSSTLVNCTLTANPAGGAYYGLLTNCLAYDNGGGWNQIGATMNYCCTTPLPGSGVGNFTNAPVFVDPAAGNFRLQTNSPCINAGDSAAASGTTDLDGRPRVIGGTVDVGAYEFQPGVSGEFIGWLSQYGLPTNGSADYLDSDGDLLNNWQEWIAGTVPTDAASALRMLNPANSASGVIVSWKSVSNRTYFLERATNLGPQPPFSGVADNIVSQGSLTTFTDTNAIGKGPFFYRVGVRQ